MVHCPECGSQRLYRDGLRLLSDGSETQRWLCRSCGYRFSENGKNVNRSIEHRLHRQICVSPERKARNLAEVEPLKDGLAGATTDVKGRIVEYLWHLKKQGRSDHTILAHRKVLTRLAKHGANLLDPESVKEIVAMEEVHVNTKVHYVIVYKSFAEWLNLSWKPPKYRSIRKIPWLPTETELDQLIAGFKRRTAIFLMILKETMARSGEVWALEWTDLNGNVLSINAPEKGSNPRQFRISDRLVTLINALPRKDKRIFGPSKNLNDFRGNFAKRRKYLAAKLGNPRINQIKFHTFRHWGATMLYHKTRNILYVQQQLGHRCIENTMVYTQLITFDGDEYNHAHAKTLGEEDKLIDAGFEFVRYDDKEQVALYRKRK